MKEMINKNFLRLVGLAAMLAFAFASGGCSSWFRRGRTEYITPPTISAEYIRSNRKIEVTASVPGNPSKNQPHILKGMLLVNGKTYDGFPKITTGFGKNGYQQTAGFVAPQDPQKALALLIIQYNDGQFKASIPLKNVDRKWIPGGPTVARMKTD